MPKLGDDDLRKILGPNFQEQVEAFDASALPQDLQRSISKRIERFQDSRFLVVYMALTGIVLIVTSLYSVTGLTLQIQVGVAIAMVIVGMGLAGTLQGKLRTLRRRLIEVDSKTVKAGERGASGDRGATRVAA